MEWTPELESQIRQMLYVQSARFSTDTNERNSYVVCCMSKLKLMFPDSVPSMQNGISDTLVTVITKMGQDCAVSFKKEQQVWQPVLIEQLKLQFYSLPEVKLLPQSARKEYVDCLALSVVSKFPKGLASESKASLKAYILKARKKCLTLIANKYGSKTEKVTVDSSK